MRTDITIRGRRIYRPDGANRMVALIRSGLPGLEEYHVTHFAPDDVNPAVTDAAAKSGPFRLTVIRP